MAVHDPSIKGNIVVRTLLIKGLHSAALLFLGIHAAGPVQPGYADECLTIATFQADVTPPIGSPLCNGSTPPVKRVDLPLSARGVVLLTRPSPIVLCAVDWVGIGNAAHDAWREALARAAGTTAGRVTVHAVHQHDAPGCDFSTDEVLESCGLGGAMFDPAFARRAIAKTAQAVRQAVDRPRRVTHLGIGRAKVDRVASNRRLLGPDGKVKRTRMSGCRNKEARDQPEGVIDPYLRTLSFWDGDRPIACLSYYATHPQCNYGHGGVSAELPGLARAIREKALPGVAQIYFTGAGGNVAVGKYNDGSKGNRKVLSRRLADGMAAAWEATKRVPITAADVEWRVRPVALPPSERLVEAKVLKKLANTQVKRRDRIFAARELAWLRRVRSGHRIELTCLRIGPACVLHMPGELCIEYQLAAQRMRPDATVCMAAYADFGPGYICTRIAYAQGGYESGWVSRVSPDVEDVLMGALRELLK